MLESGRSRSGKATSNAMTPEQRTERAKAGAAKRSEIAAAPKIVHQGELKIGDLKIPCYVLDNGRRVLSGRGLQDALRLVDDIPSSQKAGSRLPRLFENKSLIPFLNKHVKMDHLEPITCYEGKSKIHGYDAEILPSICEALLEARQDGKTNTPRISIIAAQCELLVRGFARVGITALIDEATGYQSYREKTALAEILEAFVAKELQPWLKTFPDEYYKNIYRIYNLPYPPKNKTQAKPGFIGKLTNDIVYSRLAPELLPELKKAATKAEKKAKLHQFLTSDIGHPRLREHLASIVTLLKLSKTPEDFKEKVSLIHPRFTENYSFDFQSDCD